MRHWIKVRLQDTEMAEYAFKVVEFWREQRIATINIVKAVSLFHTLSNGDTSLLKEYFPLLGEAVISNQSDKPLVTPAVSGKPKTRLIEKSADDDLDDFLESMGID